MLKHSSVAFCDILQNFLQKFQLCSILIKLSVGSCMFQYTYFLCLKLKMYTYILILVISLSSCRILVISILKHSAVAFSDIWVSLLAKYICLCGNSICVEALTKFRSAINVLARRFTRAGGSSTILDPIVHLLSLLVSYKTIGSLLGILFTFRKHARSSRIISEPPAWGWDPLP